MNSPSALPITKVWLQPEHSVATARLLLNGHKVSAIGIVDSQHQLVGFVTLAGLAGAEDTHPLEGHIQSAQGKIDLHTPIREAALILSDSDEPFLPVFDADRFVGVVSPRDLLVRLTESYDPMTELPWSDALRHWGAAQLRQNNEIAVIFIDLNKFGQFNKEFGHVVGDRVLKEVVAHLNSFVNPKTDLLVRYGGDEFAIGTLRDREEADELVASLRAASQSLKLPDVPSQISYSVGIYGGRRSKTRNDVHVEANLDNLVNLASRDCLANKLVGAPNAAVATEPVETLPFPVVETIQADDEPSSLTYVVLKTPNGHAVGTALKMGRSVPESVANATAKAMERAHPGTSVEVVSVNVIRAGSTELVTLESRVTRDDVQRSITAEVEANGDLLQSVASAVISSFYAE